MMLGRPDDELIHIYLTQKKCRLSDPTQQKVCDSVHVSLFSGLTLSEYVHARSLHCQSAHFPPCSRCEGFLSVAKLVIEQGVFIIIIIIIIIIITSLRTT